MPLNITHTTGVMEDIYAEMAGGDFIVGAGTVRDIEMTGLGAMELNSQDLTENIVVRSTSGMTVPCVVTGDGGTVRNLIFDGVTGVDPLIQITAVHARYPDWRISTTRGGVEFLGATCRFNLATNWDIGSGSNTDNTYDAVTFTNADENQIHGLTAYSLNPGVADPRYAVVFDANSDNNLIYGLIAPNTGTGVSLDSGTGNTIS